MINHQSTTNAPSQAKEFHFKKPLSAREKEILLLIAYENTNQEIANKLFLAKGTIATYRNMLLTKMSAKNTAGIVRIAFEEKILYLNQNNKTAINSHK